MNNTIRLAMIILTGALIGAAAKSPPPVCQRIAFEGNAFDVCTFNPSADELRLALHDASGPPLRSFAALRTALGADASRVRFAMNAGMFDAAGEPVGLYVESGRRLHALSTGAGSGNFYLKPNGVFWLDGAGAHIDASDAYTAKAPNPTFATQSGPLLVTGGSLHPAILPNGASKYVRNGVGVCRDGLTRFAISRGTVSFGRFARLFRDKLDCPDALYLDGAISSLWRTDTGRMDSGNRLGPLVVVLEKAP